MLDRHQELIDIIDSKRLVPHFQPIVSLSKKKIIGYEALIRGPLDSALHNPIDLFTVAEQFNLSTQLEFICREVTIQRYARLAIKEKLFINASPQVLLHPEFKKGETLRLLDQYGVNPRSVIIELTEHRPADNYQVMRVSAEHYRSMGFEIALDDLGAGYSGLRLWAELLPEYVKVDKHFIRDLDQDPVKFNIVRSIQSIAASLNCSVIAEGIETEAEFKTICRLNIQNAQGFFFAKPAAMPCNHLDDTVFTVDHAESPGPLISILSNNSTTAEDIIKEVTPILSNTRISDVLQIFHQNIGLDILPVIENDLPIGLIFRDKFLTKLFSSRYGIDLYGKRPIKSFIDHELLCIDKFMPIDHVSHQLTTLSAHDPAFVITDEGKYLGIGTLLDVLAEVTRQQLDNAKHANPLTLLPGSVPINNQINQLLGQKIPFSLGYFDLDNFKPFNDVYGYSAGDQIIKAVANILTHFIPNSSGIVGHIGGDDFIVVFNCDDWLMRCERILAEFKNIVPGYYNARDLESGGIHTEDRAGNKRFFPLVSLSVGLVDQQATYLCESHVDLADLATEAKKMAKKTTGNSLFINRRASEKIAEHFPINMAQASSFSLLVTAHE